MVNRRGPKLYFLGPQGLLVRVLGTHGCHTSKVLDRLYCNLCCNLYYKD